MFIIRQQQVQSFKDEARRRFLAAAAEHLVREFPDRWTGTGDSHLLTWIDPRVADAEGMGLITQRQVVRYLELAVILGDDFARHRRNRPVLRRLVDESYCDDWGHARSMLVAMATGG